MEAVTGQFYIAILVASLIGIRLSSAAQEDAQRMELKRRAGDAQSST